MSYAPIYNKLRELEERLAVVEVSPPKSDVSSWNTIADASVSEVSQVSGYDNLGVLSEIATLRTELDILSKECALNSSAVSLLSTDNSTKDDVDVSALATKEELGALAAKGEAFALATKDELVALATKDELVALATKDELVALATKDELVALATKDDVADLNTKFDNVINVLAQLNEKINDAHAKIAAIDVSE
jgi:hypothetical protein